jgi:hypothetical protein
MRFVGEMLTWTMKPPHYLAWKMPKGKPISKLMDTYLSSNP